MDTHAAAGVPIDEAARALGISRATVRRRLRSGALMGTQVSGPHGPMWVVHLPEHARVPTPPQQGTHGVTGERGEEPLALVVARLEAHVDDLRRQLEDRARAEERLHTLLAQAQRVLTDTHAAAQAESAPAQQSAPSPGWEARRWWQRLLWG